MKKNVKFALTGAVMALQVSSGVAQFGRPAGGWSTSAGMNAQRNSSIQRDVWITPAAVAGGDFRYQWTWKPAGAPHVPSVVAVTMQNGLFKPLSMVAFGPSYYATIDNETGMEYWTKTVAAAPAKGCESASAITRGGDANTPVPDVFVPNGIAGTYYSALSNPGEGAPIETLTQGATDAYLKTAGDARAAGKPVPPPPPRVRPGAPPPSALGDAAGAAGAGLAGIPPAAGGATPAGATTARPVGGGAGGGVRFAVTQGFYAVTPDGVLHNFGQNAAKDLVQPRPFLQANSKVTDLIVVSNVAYATVSGGCGGADAGLYAIATGGAMDAAKTSSLKTGDMLGGPTFTNNGAMFVVTGKGGQSPESILSVDPKTLAVKESFAVPSGPAAPAIVTRIADKDFLAIAGKDGNVHLIDPVSLKPVVSFDAKAGGIAAGKASSAVSLIAWKDAGNVTWLGEQTQAGFVAMRVGGTAGSPTLTSAWNNSALGASETPLVVGGVIFGVGPEKTRLVAIDGSNGKTLWSSEKRITSPINSQPWYSLGQVYVATQDSTVYAFGMPMERY